MFSYDSQLPVEKDEEPFTPDQSYWPGPFGMKVATEKLRIRNYIQPNYQTYYTQSSHTHSTEYALKFDIILSGQQNNSARI